ADRYVSSFLGIKEIEKRRAKGQGDTPAWREWYRRMCVVKAFKSLLRSGLVPLTKVMSEELKSDLDEQPQELAKPIVGGPTQQICVVPTTKDAGEQHLFDELNDEPLPDAERAAENARGALTALMEQKGVKHLSDWTQKLWKKDVEIQDLSQEQAEQLAA